MLALDLGGTRIKLGLVRGGEVIAQDVIDAQAKAGIAARLPAIAEALRALCDRAGVKVADCGGIGMAFPSIIEPRSQRIMSTNDKYPDATQVDLVGWARSELGLPFRVENDANAALAGEWQYGAGRGVRSCVILTLGTGIGSSAVIDGVPLRGQHGQAGNLGGHFVLNPFGKPCTCGGRGCVETEASEWALPGITREHPKFSSSTLAKVEKINFLAILECAADGDECAIELRDRTITYWAAAAVNMVHSFDPELIILTGGIMKTPEPTVSMIQKFVNDNAWVGWGKVKVAAGTLGDSAALLGLGYLASNLNAEE